MKREFYTQVGTGAILNVSLGFQPDRIFITNSNDMNTLEVLASGAVVKSGVLTTAASGIRTDEASGVTFYAGDKDTPAGITLAATGTCSINTAHDLYIVAETFN